MKLIYIIRGLPGSGKSTIAKSLSSYIYEADQFFYDENDNYNFNPQKIGLAHKFCKENVEDSMAFNDSPIVVSNTFTQKWEVEPYIELAKKYEYNVVILTVQSNFENIHNVPNEAIERMKKRWEYFTLEDFNV